MLHPMPDTTTPEPSQLAKAAEAAWQAHSAELTAVAEEKRAAAVARANDQARRFIDALVSDAGTDLAVTPPTVERSTTINAAVTFEVDGLRFRTVHPGEHSRSWTELLIACDSCEGVTSPTVEPTLPMIGRAVAAGFEPGRHAERCPKSTRPDRPRIVAQVVSLADGAVELEEVLTSILRDREAAGYGTSLTPLASGAVLVTYEVHPHDPNIEPF